MVTGGVRRTGTPPRTLTGATPFVELFRPDGTQCNLPSLPSPRKMLTQSGLLACGGGTGRGWAGCFKFSEGSWTTSHTLLNRRMNHVAWSGHPDGVLLMGGSGGQDYKSTEMVSTSNSSTIASFTLAYRIL